MKILIAEDDFTSRSMLTAILKKWGYDPVVTEDGMAAWDALQKPDAPRLVLLDWNMPGLDGLEVCRRLRTKETPNPPYVILLTGRGEKGDIVRGLEAGANDYIAKPYDNAELQARIRVGQRMLELQAKLLEARDALAHQATHDALTGIFNRRAILDRLAQEISRAERDGTPLSVGMFDIDHFKKINDTFGHQAGDDVLVAFARCSSRIARLRLCRPLRRRGVPGHRHRVGGTGRRKPVRASSGRRLRRRDTDENGRCFAYGQRRCRVGNGRQHGRRPARGGRRGALRSESRRAESGGLCRFRSSPRMIYYGEQQRCCRILTFPRVLAGQQRNQKPTIFCPA